MSVLTFPSSIPISHCKWSLVSRSQTFESELSGTSQDLALPGDRWTAEVTVTDLTGRDARLLAAFVTSLRGRQGRFYFSPPGCGTPLGTALGTPLVNGASQSGNTLITDGWTANQAEALAIGDYFQIGNELKQITATAAANALGAATLTFTPPLRTSPADNAAITVVNPMCVMKLADENQSAFELAGPRVYAFSFAIVEPLDI